MTRKSKWGVNVSLLIISCFLALLVSETLSRFLFKIELPYFADLKGNRTSIRLPDDELQRRLKPNFRGKLISAEFQNSITTNSLGFRGLHEYVKEKNGKFRIFGLGDSFTFGYGVEEDEIYLSVLEKKLERELGIKNETFKLGVFGYGTLQQLKLFHKFLEYKPDLIILGFFARNYFAAEGGNDLVDNYYFNEWEKTRNKPKVKDHITKAGHASFMRKVRNFLRDHSNLYRIIEMYFGGYLRKNYTPKDNPELREKGWQITKNALKAFDKELQALNIKCLILWIPFPESINARDNSVIEKLKSFRLQNIFMVNPLEAMVDDVEKYYYKLDCHWNAEGHRVAAGLLFKKILEKGIIDSAL